MRIVRVVIALAVALPIVAFAQNELPMAKAETVGMSSKRSARVRSGFSRWRQG